VDGRLGPEHILFLKGLVIDRHQARSVSYFYDQKEAMRTAALREAVDGSVSDETIRRQAVLDVHAEMMADLRQLESKVGKRRDYQYQPYIVGLARAGLGYDELEHNPNPLTDKDAPEEIRAVVQQYSILAVNQATEPLKTKTEYKSEEAYEAQRKSRIRGEARFGALQLDYDEARKLLLDHYMDEYGHVTDSYHTRVVALRKLYPGDEAE
jgi:hypothetical protein